MRDQGSQANGEGGHVRDQGSQGKGGGYVRDQGSRANGGGGCVRDQASQGKAAGGGLRPMVGVAIQDTRGLITGEAGLYKIPGVSSPRRWVIQDTRVSSPGGGAIQDTRGIITGEAGLYKIPGVSSLERGGAYEGTITSACNGGSLASIVERRRDRVWEEPDNKNIFSNFPFICRDSCNDYKLP